MPKESKTADDFRKVYRECKELCKELEFAADADVVEHLTYLPTADLRREHVKKLKQLTANAAAQKPQSAARTPGASAAGKTVVKEEKAVPTGGKEFAAFIRD